MVTDYLGRAINPGDYLLYGQGRNGHEYRIGRVQEVVPRTEKFGGNTLDRNSVVMPTVMKTHQGWRTLRDGLPLTVATRNCVLMRPDEVPNEVKEALAA